MYNPIEFFKNQNRKTTVYGFITVAVGMLSYNLNHIQSTRNVTNSIVSLLISFFLPKHSQFNEFLQFWSLPLRNFNCY